MDPDPELDEGLDDGGGASDEVVLGPGGLEDPETEWHIEGLEEALPDLTTLEPGEFVLLRPGEDPEITSGLPKPRHLQLAIAFSQQDVVLCSGRRRQACPNHLGCAPDPAERPAAEGLTLVFIEHRADRNRMRSRNYAIITADDGSLLGWLDYSDSWGFAAHQLKGLVEQCGLEFRIERYPNEPAFQAAHPDWIG